MGGSGRTAMPPFHEFLAAESHDAVYRFLTVAGPAGCR